MSNDDAPTISELIERIISARLESQRGPQPGEVVTYNPATQTADVRPLLSILVDGELVDPPILRSVPVQWTRGGQGALTFPLAPLDIVYLVPSEVDLGPWHASAGVPIEPQKRRFSLADMVAIPGVASKAAPLPATAYDIAAVVLSGLAIKLGSSAAVSPISLAPLTEAFLAAIDVQMKGLGLPGLIAPITVASATVKAV